MAVLLTFFVVFIVILGAYWLLIAKHDAETHRALQKRLRPPEEAVKKGGLALSKDETRSQGAARSKGLQALIDQSGKKTTVPKLLATCALTGCTVGLVVWVISGAWIAGLAAGALAFPIPYGLVSRAAGKRLDKFEEQFPEAIDLIARALRAGHAFPTGLSMVADELGEPVGAEFKLLYDRQNFGMPLPDALRSFAQRVPIIDARFFVTAVLTQREAGGNLSGVLDNLSAVIRERFKVKRQVKVISAQGRMTGMILMGLPIAVAIFQFIVTPSNLKTLIEDPVGPWLIGTAVGMQAIGWMWIQKVIRIEY